jgi:hypothetical protein
LIRRKEKDIARHPSGNTDLIRRHAEHQREADREVGQTRRMSRRADPQA